MTDRPASGDADREWAVRIGQALERIDDPDDLSLSDLSRDEVSVESGSGARDPEDDALLAMLFAYRQQVVAGAERVPVETSERIWAGIEDELGSEEVSAERRDSAPSERTEADRDDRDARQSDRSARSPSRTVSSTVWRVAAVTVAAAVVAVTAWWWTTTGTGAVLVAETTGRAATYEAADGSVARLRPNSRLYRIEALGASGEEGGSVMRFRLEGEAVFDVPSRETRVFEVEAGDAVVRVLGTRFTVRTWTPDPQVDLDEGRVELRPPGGESPVVLQPGQRGVARASGVTTAPTPAGAFADWLDGQIRFDERPAAAVAAELEQHFGVRLQLPDSVATQTLTGRLFLDDRAQALQDFGTVLGGRFVKTGEGRYAWRE